MPFQLVLKKVTLKLDKISLTITITFILLATFTSGYLVSWLLNKYQLKSLLGKEKVSIQKPKSSQKTVTKTKLKSKKG